jgi:hypothetical protein
MDFRPFQVSYKTAAGIKKITSITGLSIEDVRNHFKDMIRVDNNEYFDCTLIKVWENKPPTAKQKLAQKYGFIIGSVKNARIQFTNAMQPDNIKDAHKLSRNWHLTMQQFAKLERDIRDCFKLAGLKVK